MKKSTTLSIFVALITGALILFSTTDTFSRIVHRTIFFSVQGYYCAPSQKTCKASLCKEKNVEITDYRSSKSRSLIISSEPNAEGTKICVEYEFIEHCKNRSKQEGTITVKYTCDR